MEIVKKLDRELDQTFVIATHNILAARECTRVCMLRDGKILNIYKPSEISKLFQF